MGKISRTCHVFFGIIECRVHGLIFINIVQSKRKKNSIKNEGLKSETPAIEVQQQNKEQGNTLENNIMPRTNIF